MRLGLLFAVVLFGVPLYSQTTACTDVAVRDTRFPTFPPIAKAAHLQASIKLSVHLSSDGKAKASYLEGPKKGVYGTFVDQAISYISGREHSWYTGGEHHACDYEVTVEYKILPVESDIPNNFAQVTVMNEHYTLLEVNETKPTVTP